jgi:carbon storage regulator
MLILPRKPEESIVINDQIRIVVLDVRGGRVRLGIEAPQAIRVCREEVTKTITGDRKRSL